LDVAAGAGVVATVTGGIVGATAMDPVSALLAGGRVVVAGGSERVVSLVVGVSFCPSGANSTADGGLTAWSSTTETPAQATPIAAVLAANHITTRASFFTVPVSRWDTPNYPKPTINHP